MRVNIPHFHTMQEAALNTIRYKGTVCFFGSKTVLKVDGLYAEFGKDMEGMPYFQSARSPRAFAADAGLFVKFAKECGRPLARAEAYESLMADIFASELSYALPRGTHITCEILDMKQAVFSEDGSHATFVNVPYEVKRLGKRMTILPYSIDTHFAFSVSGKSILHLQDNDAGNGISIIDPTLQPLFKILNLPTDTLFGEAMLKELAACFYETQLESVRSKLGLYNEGLVVYIDRKPYKITEKTYDDVRKKNLFARS